ncbi:FG-GAP repeat protein [Xenococcus sp. PCC 7305]|uniref:integrin alpha n=1 Tax=Xenococcus sp. PCC 7305 TaxID=102125 RepID=UPI0002ACA870|nr:integrin alpha [Xenococcus sp. PCC 7305]ELS04788.1 FG-GAP repeat protein [Xenococcus sp. PCC 7305]
MNNSTFDLSGLNGSNGFVINGIGTYDYSGSSVSNAGDINGDGIEDIIIAANPNIFPEDSLGKSYVLFGSSNNFASSFDLATLDGSNGFVINGINATVGPKFVVSNAGDINGDDLDDLIIGASYAETESGRSYVVFGSDNGFASSLDLATLNGSNGFALNGINFGDRSGYSVSNAGDVNGDGIEDIIIGASSASPNRDPFNIFDLNVYSGQSYVVFGRNTGFDSNVDLATLDGSNGFALNGIDAQEQSGRSVSSAGDINGDGFDDIIIGAPFANVSADELSTGKSYVVFGSNNAFASSLDLSTLDGNNGFTINGANAADRSGFSVSNAGDVNGDGLDDIIIGARYASPNGNAYAGASYVVFGSNSGFSRNFDLSTLDGTNGFAINGIDAGDFTGDSVSNAGDVNADGIDDIIIGASVANDNVGESYVVFGSTNGFASSLDLSALDGNNGFILKGIDPVDQLGNSVSSAGDFNADGIDDFIIAASTADPNGNVGAGESYLVFGSDSIIGNNDITELYRFRNTSFGTGTYLFVGEQERDAILANPDFNQTFVLEGDGNPAFKASAVPGDDLLPFFRLQSLAVPGTFLFVSTDEYNGIFAEGSAQREQWEKEGLDQAGVDIPEFYLFGAGTGKGIPFNRFQNNDNNTFLFAGSDSSTGLSETDFINNDPNLSAVFNDQGIAFESLL